MVNKEICIKNLKEAFSKLFDNPELSEKVCLEMFQRGFDYSESYKIVLLMVDLESFSNETLLSISEVIRDVCVDYFSKKLYDKILENCDGLSKNIYPIIFDRAVMIQSGQYLTCVTPNFLNEMIKQKVFYIDEDLVLFKGINPLTDEDIFLQRNPKKDAVKNILTLMEKQVYTPQEITVSTDSISDLRYESDTGKLYIEKGNFRIIDGEVNLQAILTAFQENKINDFPVILRIVNYTNDQVKNHIWQDGHKRQTIINPVSTENTSKNSNLLTDMLNNDRDFRYYKEIKFKGGVIKYEHMSQLLNITFPVKKADELPQIERYIRDIINMLPKVEFVNPTTQTCSISFRKLYVIIRSIGYGYKQNFDVQRCFKIVHKAFYKVNSLPTKNFNTRKVRKVCTRDVDKLIEEVVQNDIL